MRIVAIGGGPAGLYFGILMKQAFPDVEIEILERNRPDDTFGFGVVFSDETLSFFEDADPDSAAADPRPVPHLDGDRDPVPRRDDRLDRPRLRRHRAHRAARDPAAARPDARLHAPLRARGRGSSASCPRPTSSSAATASNSAVRERFAGDFRPPIDLRPNRFTWLGTDCALPAFTFVFEETEHGLFQVHAYPFAAGRCTFIVECGEETWRRAGLDRASEAETVAFCERLFADHLDGHRLLANRSIWRQFPTVRCGRWHHDNVVLLGDAAHTAHFSIGSGTKLAMEDAIALVAAFRGARHGDVPAALAAYEEARRVDVAKLQRAAQTSLEWFENVEPLPRPGPGAVHLQPDDALEAHHLRQPEGARPGARGARRSGVRRGERAPPRRGRRRSRRSGSAASSSRTASSSRRCASTRRWTAR